MAGPGEAMRRPLRGDVGECPGRGRGAVPGVPSIPCPPLALSLPPLPCDLGQRGACLLPLVASRLGVFRVGWVSPFTSQRVSWAGEAGGPGGEIQAQSGETLRSVPQVSPGRADLAGTLRPMLVLARPLPQA